MCQIYKNLGSSGKFVSSLGYGTMLLSVRGRPSEKESISLIHSAFDAGINFIDTANVYCLDNNEIGHNERLISKAIRTWPDRSSLMIATKGGVERPDGAWISNGHPNHLKKSCEASLKALDIECIDLYQLHQPDDRVPFEESIGALSDLKKSGKVNYLGLSNVTLEHIIKARHIINIVSIQNCANLCAIQDFQNGILKYCEKEDISYLAHSPMGGRKSKQFISENAIVKEISKQYDITPFQVAIAWLLAKSPIVIPIFGTTKLENIKNNINSLNIRLNENQLNKLNNLIN